MHSDGPYDFRSDTVTLPTRAMMSAIAAAPLGDAGRGDDPTVNALERLAAGLAGKDDAVFVPSGTMANLAALLAHEVRGGEVIVEETAHLYNSEGGGLSVVAGAVPRPLRSQRGLLDPDDVKAAFRGGADLALAPTRLVCLENTHNAAGGAVLPLEHLAAIHGVCRGAGIPVHLDGARLFNAAAFLDVPMQEICRHVDSVWFALCKGLGGPVGAILAGDGAFMVRARRAVKMLGGGMRQAGLIAAPAIVALEDPYPALRRDHALAHKLGAGLAAIDASLVDVGRVQTNIVNCFVDRFADDSAGIVLGLRQRGVLANFKRTKIRFVTHAQVDEDAVEAAVRAFAEVIR
ncbi:MAG: low specificity L-threonine aldolase [Reyranellaceae bacterium]